MRVHHAAAFLTLLSTGCSLLVEDIITQLPARDAGTDAPPPGAGCRTTQDCLGIEEQRTNCRQVCVAGSDGLGRCAAGTAPDGTFCGDVAAEDEICVSGLCVERECGDGFADRRPGRNEYCDDGNGVETDRCNNSCTRSCMLPGPSPICDDDVNGVDLATDACLGGVGECDTELEPTDLCVPPDPVPDGTDCTVGDQTGRCEAGRCTIALVPG